MEFRRMTHMNTMSPDHAERTPDMAGWAAARAQAEAASAEGAGERAEMASAACSAWDFAQKATAQAADVAKDLYERGARAGALVTRQVQDNPLPAILVAGALGCGIGYMIHGGRRPAAPEAAEGASVAGHS
jgi:hypothetical protein